MFVVCVINRRHVAEAKHKQAYREEKIGGVVHVCIDTSDSEESTNSVLLTTNNSFNESDQLCSSTVVSKKTEQSSDEISDMGSWIEGAEEQSSDEISDMGSWIEGAEEQSSDEISDMGSWIKDHGKWVLSLSKPKQKRKHKKKPAPIQNPKKKNGRTKYTARALFEHKYTVQMTVAELKQTSTEEIEKLMNIPEEEKRRVYEEQRQRKLYNEYVLAHRMQKK